jgi:DNA-binding protein YbaB
MHNLKVKTIEEESAQLREELENAQKMIEKTEIEYHAAVEAVEVRAKLDQDAYKDKWLSKVNALEDIINNGGGEGKPSMNENNNNNSVSSAPSDFSSSLNKDTQVAALKASLQEAQSELKLALETLASYGSQENNTSSTPPPPPPSSTPCSNEDPTSSSSLVGFT